MRPLPPSLSHRSLTIKKVGEAPGIRKTELGALYTPNRRNRFFARSGKNLQRFGTSRRADRLSPHHDYQFSAFSTEVLLWINQGTIIVVLPLLPQLIQRNVRQQAQEPGNPTIDQRHDSEPMHTMLNSGCRTILYKKCSDFCFRNMGCYEAPGKHQTYQSVWVLPDRVIHRGAERKKRKKTEKVQRCKGGVLKLQPQTVVIVI